MRATGAHAALSTSAALPRLWGYGSVYKVWQSPPQPISPDMHAPAAHPGPRRSVASRWRYRAEDRTGETSKTTHGSTTVPLSAVGRLLARYTPVAGTFRRGEEDGDGGYLLPGRGCFPHALAPLKPHFSLVSPVWEKIEICAFRIVFNRFK